MFQRGEEVFIKYLHVINSSYLYSFSFQCAYIGVTIITKFACIDVYMCNAHANKIITLFHGILN